ncbi:hypothetical protein TIFTF001_052630, partial [Ficus carica]
MPLVPAITAFVKAVLSPHTPSSQLLKLEMSESCLPSSPPLMLPSASSSQPTTSPLSSSPPGFGRNVRE